MDEGAIPSAEAKYKLSMAQCGAAITDKRIATVGQYVECQLAAERTMATDIKLQKMDLYEAYAGRMRLIGQQADARQITPEQMSNQMMGARNDLMQQIAAAYRNNEQQRAKMAAAFAAMGQAARDQQMINAINRPVVCNSNKFGNQVTTTCN